MQHVTGLQDLGNRASRLIRALSLEDRLVEIVVEALALRVDPADTVSLEADSSSRSVAATPARRLRVCSSLISAPGRLSSAR